MDGGEHQDIPQAFPRDNVGIVRRSTSLTISPLGDLQDPSVLLSPTRKSSWSTDTGRCIASPVSVDSYVENEKPRAYSRSQVEDNTAVKGAAAVMTEEEVFDNVRNYYKAAGGSAETTQSGSEDGWSKVDKILEDYDENKIRDCKEDIDTLLVFAGLFSAVVTAFNIDLYKALQPPDMSAQLLLQISQQLASFAVSTTFLNSTIPPITTMPSFQAPVYAIHVNILWFASLVCSLVTASLGILVKQWLREYMSQDSLSPQLRRRVRHYRYTGLVRFRVFEIAAFLPLLLQTALMLFFVGLMIFLWNLHRTVADVVLTLIVIWLVLLTVTTAAPIFSAQCPYKTPFLRDLLQRIRPTMGLVVAGTVQRLKSGFYWPIPTPAFNEIIPRVMLAIPKHAVNCLRFVRRAYFDYVLGYTYSTDFLNDEEKFIKHHAEKDWTILVQADALFLDDHFISILRQSLVDVSLPGVLSCIRQIIGHRVGRNISTLSELPPLWSSIMSREALQDLAHILIDGVDRDVQWRLDLFGALDSRKEYIEILLFIVRHQFYDQAKDIGLFFSRLLQIGGQMTLTVIGCLANDSTQNIMTPPFLPQIQIDKHTTPQLIAVSRRVVVAKYSWPSGSDLPLHPAQLYRVILTLAVQMEDPLLRDSWDSLEPLLSHISIDILAALPSESDVSTTLDRWLLDAIERNITKLKTRLPEHEGTISRWNNISYEGRKALQRMQQRQSGIQPPLDLPIPSTGIP